MRILLVAVLLIGCQLTVGPGGLPVYDPGSFCSLAGLVPTMLHIEPDSDAPTWVVAPGGHRENLEWPIGFSLEVIDGVPSVVDPDGNVVATDGAKGPS